MIPIATPSHIPASGAGRASVVFRALLVGVLCSPVMVVESASAQNLNQQDVDAIVAKAAAYLKQSLKPNDKRGEASISCYALIKAGVPKTDPLVQGLLKGIASKVNSEGVYKPTNHGFYEAGVDIMALEAADPEQYKPQMEAMVQYIIDGQSPSGAWFYPDGREAKYAAGGDTSIVQYAILGLWAADRAGVEFPYRVLDAAAAWHAKTQLGNGGFCYHPTGKNEVRHTMTVAGAGSMMIIYRMLYPEKAGEAEANASKKSAKFGILEQEDLTARPDRKGRPGNANFRPSTAASTIERSGQRALGWVGNNFAMSNLFPMYNLYAVERMASLANIKTIRNANWYLAGAQFMQKNQLANGSWASKHCGPQAATAFGILFLTRATGKTIGSPPAVPAGSGMMIGGRGLPENLAEVGVGGDGEVKENKVSGPLDEMLSNLGKLDSLETDLDGVQEAIVEKVQLGDREALIGEKDRLQKLTDHPNVEVRRTAVWALGRCEDLTLASDMIKLLDDPDLSVAVEAHNALCVLTRQPNGPTIVRDPLRSAEASNFPGLPLEGFESADEKTKLDAARKWRGDAKRAWNAWYNRIRPYEERDDLGELIEEIR